jgi:hypothetical protein
MFAWPVVMISGAAGMVISKIMDDMGADKLGGVIFILFATLPAIACLWLIKLNYDFENLEHLLAAAKTFLRGRRLVNLGKETRYVMRDESFYGLDGVQVIGFEMLLPDELEDDSVEIFISRFETLLRNLPIGHRIRYYRQSLPFPAKSEKEKILRVNKSYVTFDLFPGTFGSFSQKSFMDNINGLPANIFRPLSKDELMALPQRIINPEAEPQPLGEDHPWYRSPISLMRDQALLHVGAIEDRALLLSLADLPEVVGNDVQKLYDHLNKATGTVAVTFQTLANELFLPTARKKLIERTIRSFFKKTDEDPTYIAPDDQLRLRLHVSAILHGKPEYLQQIESECQDVISRMASNERPVLARDNAFMREAVLAILPGMPASVPFRRKVVLRKSEAVRYLPLPMRAGDPTAPLHLRTEANSRFGWDVDTGHPTLIVAKVESGKSTLMQRVIMKHITKPHRVASFTMEVGGSFEALTEGLAQGYFTLERESETSELVPLPEHPLRVLISFGSYGKERAYAWIKATLGIPSSKPLLENCAKAALEKCDHLERYAMDDFYLFLEEAIDAAYAEQDLNEDHSARQLLYKAAAYTSSKGGTLGRFFNPETPRNIDYTKVHHWYFRQKSASAELDELAMPFFNFGLELLSTIRKRYEPDSTDPRNLLVTIDEVHFILGYIEREYWVQLNKQGRKQNIGVIMATQNMNDIKDKLGDKYEAMLSLFSRFVFNHGISNMRDLAKAVGKDDQVEFVTKSYTECTRRTEEYRARGVYAWGFINEFAEFNVYILDLDRDEVWEGDTRPTAKYIRRKTIAATGLEYFEACRRLAKYGPKAFHKSNLPDDKYLEEIIRKVRYGNDNEA